MHTGMRFQSPRLHARLIDRPRLHARLNAGIEHGAVSIAAPPGYGKTTLTAMWLHERAARMGDVTIWISLQAEDADPFTFIQHLVESIAAHVPKVRELVVVGRSGQATPQDMLTRLLRLLAQHSSTVILAIDDIQLLHDQPATTLLQHLVDARSSDTQLVLLSRTTPHVRIPEDALQLHAGDLRFDHDEFLRYAAVCLAGVSDHRLQDIESCADGWIMALQLLSLASHSSHSTPALSNTTGQTRDFLIEYLDRIVLRSLSDRAQQLLLAVSYAPQFDEALATALTGLPMQTCADIIRDLMAASAPIQAFTTAATQHDMYRLHALFGSFLIQELHRRYSPDAIRDLHHRAAEHFAARGDIDAALALHLRTNDRRAAAALVAAHGHEQLIRYEYAAVRRWLTHIGEEHVEQDLGLSLLAGWRSLFTKEGGTHVHIEHARRLITTQPHDEDRDTEILVLQALHSIAQGDPNAMQSFVREAAARPTPKSAFVTGYRHIASAMIAPNPDDQLAHLQAATAALEQKYGDYGVLVTSMFQAVTYRQIGNLPAALHAHERQLQAIERTNREISFETIAARVAYAETLYWVDQIDQSQQHLQRTLAAKSDDPAMQPIFTIAQAQHELCLLAQKRKCMADSRPSEDDEQWMRSIKNAAPHAIGFAAYLRVVRDVLRNDEVGIRRTLQSTGYDALALDVLDPFAAITVLTASLYRGDTTPTAAQVLERLATPQPHGNFGLRICAGLLLACYADRLGRHKEADAQLSALLQQMLTSNTHRFAVDMPMLHPLLERNGTPYARRILHRAGRSPDANDFGLTEQEFAVLRCAAAGMNNREIAATLGVTPKSIYDYSFRIYRKLNVHSRREAVRIARDAGIVA
jgi:LuxR family maltose regulon positive regulatory protein